MSGALAGVEALFPTPSFDPVVAASVIILGNLQSPPARCNPDHLDKALQAVAPHLADADRAGWVAALTECLGRACISTPRCVAAFLGQCAVESAGFRCLEEDLAYSAERLCEVWPSRFPSVEAAEAYAMRPEVLANRVYANRMGNGDEASGDGWRFRGRGLIQITGRAAYQRFAQAIGQPLDQAADYAATPNGAVESAIWFWTENHLNAPAQAWSLDLLTQKINGGLSGAAERTRLCEAALQAIGA